MIRFKIQLGEGVGDYIAVLTTAPEEYDYAGITVMRDIPFPQLNINPKDDRRGRLVLIEFRIIEDQLARYRSGVYSSDTAPEHENPMLNADEIRKVLVERLMRG